MWLVSTVFHCDWMANETRVQVFLGLSAVVEVEKLSLEDLRRSVQLELET